MATERHIWGHDPHMDAYVEHYRKWLMDSSYEQIQGKVLDLGCGDGSCVSAYIAEWPRVGIVLGVDVHTGPFVGARNVVYLTSDATQFVAPYQFNAIVSCEFIEHIPHYELLRTLKNVKASLIHGGWFIGTTPNGHEGPTMHRSGNPFHVCEWHLDDLKHLLDHFFDRVEVADIGLNILGFRCQK